MKEVTFTRKLLAMVLTLAVVMSLQVSTVLAATAAAQGFNQKAVLFDPEYGKAHTNVTELQSAGASFVTANEGSAYFLTRVDAVYDIRQDVQIQVWFDGGMNAYSNDAWKNNGMRYMSVLDASTGEVVANWRDETPDGEGKNSSGKYQITYGAASNGAASGGVIYKIPKEAFEPSSSYFVVLGSATCGNNNNKMLYAPVIYLLTTSDAAGAGQVDNTIKVLNTNKITLNVVKSDADTSSLAFNRYSLASGYSAGDPIVASVPGQEICLLPSVSSGLSSSVTVVDAFGNIVPFNVFVSGGGNASNFGDLRFTMPNDAVTIDAVFGYTVNIEIKDDVGLALSGASIVLKDSNDRIYTAGADGSYVLPAGEYSYTVRVDGNKLKSGILDVSENATKEIALTAAELVPSLTIKLSPDSATIGETITVSGTVKPGILENDVICIKIVDADGGTVVYLDVVELDAEGTYSEEISLPAGTPGEWSVVVGQGDITDYKTINVSAPAGTPVTGVSLNETEAVIAVDGTLQLIATIEPTNADNQNVTWSTDAEGVATVSEEGLVTGVGEGAATITVTTEDGEYTASCTITVSAAEGPGPGTVANVTSETELTAALAGAETDITVIENFALSVESTKIPAGTTLTIAEGKALGIPAGKTLTIYGGLGLESGAQVSIAGVLEFGYNAAITPSNGTLQLDGGVIRFVQPPVMMRALSLSGDDITDIVKVVLANLEATTAGGTVEIGADQGVVFDVAVTIPSNVTLYVDGTINIGNGVTVDISNATVIGDGDIVLTPGATLVASLAQSLGSVTVKDFAGNELTPDNGNYTVADYNPIVITPVSGGLGESFKIEVSGGVVGSDLYLIVQSTVEGGAVSLVMIAVGAYDALGYETYVSYDDTDQVDVWLVYEDNVTGAPVWTEPETGMYLKTATYSAPVVTP